MQDRGCKFKQAKVNFLVYWMSKAKWVESLVVLPELNFVRRLSITSMIT
jgi:hypothetical protein